MSLKYISLYRKVISGLKNIIYKTGRRDFFQKNSIIQVEILIFSSKSIIPEVKISIQAQ